MPAQIDNFDLFADDTSLDMEKTGVLPKGFNAGDATDDKIEATVEAIKKVLLAGKHLVVATSFGKDSSMLLMLAIRALEEVIAIHGKSPTVYVINSNTKIENPKLDVFSRQEARKVRAYARDRGLPLEMRIASPSVSGNYLVNIIGGRLLASTPDNGRACTTELKIRPINRLKKRIARELGLKGSERRDGIVTLIGKRFDESTERARTMEANGERPDEPVKIFSDKAGKTYEWVMSPIAAWTLDDIYMGIAYVRNGMISTYSDFDDLLEIYREANDSQCIINIYSKGKPAAAPCGMRTGCWTCGHVSEDHSMKSMLNRPENLFMRPLNEFRNFLLANHYQLENRNWLSRRVNADGTINLAPNAYSPAFCLQLLRIALSIDADERDAAEELGIAPRFQMLTVEDILAIDFLWARHGYMHGMMACYTARQVENGMRWSIPEVTNVDPSRRLPEFRKMTLPFADSEFGHFSHGAFDEQAALTDQLDPFAVPEEFEFTVDPEGAVAFWEFEVDHALAQFGPVDVDGGRNNHEFAPASIAHYFLRLGTIRVSKGSRSELDRMLQVSNQIHRHGIRDHLSDPVALTAALAKDQVVLPASGGQFDLDDLIRLEQQKLDASVIVRH